MKKFIFLVTLSCFLGNVFADTIPGGEVSGTWTTAGSPYIIMGDITIPQDQSLQIDPGVVVKFNGNYGMKVDRASLFATGSPEDSIVFTSVDTSGFTNGGWDEGGWKGIFFSIGPSVQDTSRLRYCRFEYSKSEGPDGYTIKIDRQGRLIISDCGFSGNHPSDALLDCSLADPLIMNNRFTANETGTLLRFSQSNPTVANNHIDSNACSYALEFRDWSKGSYHHNILYRNDATRLIFALGNCQPRIYLNKVMNNQLLAGGCVFYLNGTNSGIINNLVVNNGGKIFDLWDDGSNIVNNSVVNNSGSSSEYLVSIHNASCLFLGNLFDLNSATIECEGGNPGSRFRYNAFNFDTSSWVRDEFRGLYEHNLENAGPHYVDPSNGPGPSYDAYNADFNIAPGPPWTNSGDPDFPDEFLTPDMWNRERIRYGRIDIGAFETNIDNETIPATFYENTTLFGDTLHVIEDIVIPDDILLTLSARSVILFHGPYFIDVQGSMQVPGTTGEPVLFTLEDTAGFAQGGYDTTGWNGIRLGNYTGSMDDNRPSIFEHCIFEYGKNPMDYGGVFTLWDMDNFVLRHCEFRYNTAEHHGNVITASRSDFDVEDCLFHHNAGGSFGVIYLDHSDNKISRSVFHDNFLQNATGIFTYECDLEMESCRFYNNSVGSGGPMVLKAEGSEIRLANCLIHNNESILSRILDFQNCSVRILNSTIAGNTCRSYIHLIRTEMEILNSIIWGNINDGNDRSKLEIVDEYSDPDIYHTLIEDGIDAFFLNEGANYTGQMSACLDTDPYFISPGPEAGYLAGADSTVWNLLDISPGIDAGIVDTTGLGLPATDFAEQARFFNGRIDMGAYEKTGKPPVIFTAPTGGNFCSGDSIVLSISYSNTDSAIIQWVKDGNTVPGEDSLSFLIYPAAADLTGNYTCELSNSFGTVQSPAVFLSIKDPPDIVLQSESEWVQGGKEHTLNITANGTSPLSYQWYKDGLIISGEELPGISLVPVDSTQEGSYTCVVSNGCGSDTTDAIYLHVAPRLCMVTVSEISGHNLVIWEKKSKATVMAYNIYRESSAAGIYDKLATVPYDDLSLFVDTIADPTVQAYLYRITAIDTAGNESDADLCEPHKTIHLLVSTNPELNTTQLEWDRYYGFDYQTCLILRSVDGSIFSQVHDIQSTLYSWTDPDPVEGELAYRIAVESPDPCTPTGGGFKAGAGPYYNSLSNLDDNRLKAGQQSPDSIYLNNYSIEEEDLPGTLIGKLFTVDGDSIDSHTYQFVTGEGDDDNMSFTLVGDLLLASESFDYETKNRYSIRIRSTDLAGNHCEIQMFIDIIDINEATGLPEVNSRDVRIFPNPFSHNATLIFRNPAGEPYTLILTDLTGKVVRTEGNIVAGEYILQRGQLDKGIYVVELRGSRTLRGKIVIE